MKEDKIIGLILIIFSVFMYSQTLEFPEAVFGTKGAGFFPKILFTLLALAGTALTLSGFIQDRKRRKSRSEEGKALKTRAWDQLKQSLNSHSQVVLSFLLVFAYIFIMDYFGYLVATLAFMLTVMWCLGPKSRKEIPKVLVISCGMTFIIYFSFQKLLQIFLPEGSLF